MSEIVDTVCVGDKCPEPCKAVRAVAREPLSGVCASDNHPLGAGNGTAEVIDTVSVGDIGPEPCKAGRAEARTLLSGVCGADSNPLGIGNDTGAHAELCKVETPVSSMSRVQASLKRTVSMRRRQRRKALAARHGMFEAVPLTPDVSYDTST